MSAGLVFISHSEADTARMARRVASHITAGDTVLLEGAVGGGKSFFARALIQSLQDIPEDVPSPTFTLVQVYDTSKGEIWHADLYRLSGPDEAAELGLLDAMPSAICLIEWPDRLGSDRPGTATVIQFEAGADETMRILTFNGPLADLLKDQTE